MNASEKDARETITALFTEMIIVVSIVLVHRHTTSSFSLANSQGIEFVVLYRVSVFKCVGSEGAGYGILCLEAGAYLLGVTPNGCVKHSDVFIRQLQVEIDLKNRMLSPQVSTTLFQSQHIIN